jgi:hypothetical protein
MLKHALDLATYLLEGGELPTIPTVADGLPPFAVGILASGAMSDFNCLPNPDKPGTARVYCLPNQLEMFARDGREPGVDRGDQTADPSASSGPSSTDAATSEPYVPPPVEAVAQGLREFAREGMIHAAALVDRVEAPSEAGEVAYAIRVHIEHVEADPITCYLPYHLSERKLVAAEAIQVPGRTIIFAT